MHEREVDLRGFLDQLAEDEGCEIHGTTAERHPTGWHVMIQGDGNPLEDADERVVIVEHHGDRTREVRTHRGDIAGMRYAYAERREVFSTETPSVSKTSLWIGSDDAGVERIARIGAEAVAEGARSALCLAKRLLDKLPADMPIDEETAREAAIIIRRVAGS